jgi:hypothetical protein
MLHDPQWQVRHQAKQVLLDAARYIETHGWCQGALQHKGRVCIFGAINAAGGHSDMAASRTVVEMLRRATHTPAWSNIAAWNDTPGRTKAQVIAALKRAATTKI